MIGPEPPQPPAVVRPTAPEIRADVRIMYRELDRVRRSHPTPTGEVLDWVADLEAWLSALYPDVPPPPPEPVL